MEDIKVGEYIRTKEDGIKKVHYINPRATVNRYEVKANGVDKEGDEYYIIIKTTHILKHSFNIIDLIEVDDIGILVCYGLKVKKFITKDDILELKLGNYQLLSLVTKEQFESIKYEV